MELLRHFGASDWEIIVTDCGSDRVVRKRIKGFNPDGLNLGPNNYAKAIVDGRTLCKREFFVFTEEDLPYVAQPLRSRDVHCQKAQNFLFPSLDFAQSKPEWGYKEAIEVLRTQPDIRYVKMAFRRSEWKDRRKVIGHQIIHPRKPQKMPTTPWFRPAIEVNNWPYLMRTEDAFAMDYPDSFIEECYCQGACNKVEAYDRIRFGYPDRNPACAGIGTPVHTHIGSWLTINDPVHNSFGGSQERRGNQIAAEFNLKLSGSSPRQRGRDLSGKLLTLWLNNQFYIDFQEILELGLDGGMRRAFSRIKGL